MREIHLIFIADGTQHSAYTINDLHLEINEYSDNLDFLVAPITYNVILGKPWLEVYNPTIDWQHNVMFFNKEGLEHYWDVEDDTWYDNLYTIIFSSVPLKLKGLSNIKMSKYGFVLLRIWQ